MPDRMVGYGPISGRAPSYMAGGHLSGGSLPGANMNYQDAAGAPPVYQYSQQGAMPIYAQQGNRLNTILADPVLARGHGAEMRQHYQYMQNMQSQMQRTQAAATGVKAASSIASWSAGAQIGSTIGSAFGPLGTVGGLVGGMVLGGAIGGIANSMIDPVVNQRMRQQAIQADVFSYRNEIGLRRTSPAYANAAGGAVANLIEGKGGASNFFDSGQKAELFKTALSGGLISAQSSGSIQSGTVNQLTKNVKELFKSTEEIVKLMNVTKEGGLALIKEMQQSGFGNISQVTNAVRAAKAFGGATGLGAQNILSMGASGAAAVQGTPFSSQLGAQTYTQTGINVGYMAKQGSIADQRAIAAVGGVGKAGQVVSNAMLNMLSSDLGTQFVASMLDPGSRKASKQKVNKIMNSPTSAYQMTSMANSTGYDLGSGVASIDFIKSDFFNNMGELGISTENGMNKMYEAYRTQYPYAKEEDVVNNFVREYTSGSMPDMKILKQYMSSNKGYAGQSAQVAAQQGRQNMYSPTRRQGNIFSRGFGATIGKGGRAFASSVMGFGEGVAGNFQSMGRGVGAGATIVNDAVLGVFGLRPDRYDYGAAAAGMGAYYGAGGIGLVGSSTSSALNYVDQFMGDGVNKVSRGNVDKLMDKMDRNYGYTELHQFNVKKGHIDDKTLAFSKVDIQGMSNAISGASTTRGGLMELAKRTGTDFSRNYLAMGSDLLIGNVYKDSNAYAAAAKTQEGRAAILKAVGQAVTGEKIFDNSSYKEDVQNRYKQLTSGDIQRISGVQLSMDENGRIPLPEGYLDGVGSSDPRFSSLVNVKKLSKKLGGIDSVVESIPPDRIKGLSGDSLRSELRDRLKSQVVQGTEAGRERSRMIKSIELLSDDELGLFGKAVSDAGEIRGMEAAGQAAGHVRAVTAWAGAMQKGNKNVKNPYAGSDKQKNQKRLARVSVMKIGDVNEKNFAEVLSMAIDNKSLGLLSESRAFDPLKGISNRSQFSDFADPAKMQLLLNRASLNNSDTKFLRQQELTDRYDKLWKDSMLGKGGQSHQINGIEFKTSTGESKGEEAGDIMMKVVGPKGEESFVKRSREDIKQLQAGAEPSSGDPGDSKVAVNPAPPILNYWNNRWIL